MNIHNIEEHQNCYCYNKGEKPMVELLNFVSGETNEFIPLTNEIAIIIKGRIEIIFSNNPGGELRAGQMVFLPAQERLKCKALTDSKILFLRINDSVELCRTFNMERLCSNMDKTEKPESIFAIELNKYLKHSTKGLLNNFKTGLRCRIYLQAEITKLLIMISAYHSEEDLFRFFYSILSPDTIFSECIRKNWLKYKNAHELATGVNMSTKQLTKRFNKVFGMSPHKWMQQEKARLVYGDIRMSNKSFKEIASVYGFSVPAHFSRFCKAAFGATPGEIRNNRRL